MHENKGSTVAIVAIVIVLMVGTLYTYMFSEIQNEPDPRGESHTYIAEAQVDGIECEGKGKSVYTPENSSYHTYRFSFDLYCENSPHTLTFGMVFGSDDRPDPTIYAYIGPGEPGEIGVWKMVDGGTTYTFHVSEYCTVTSLTVFSDRIQMTAELM